MKTFRLLGILLALVVTLAACSTPVPLQLDGLYGGYITNGASGLAFAVDINTTDEGSINGYGVMGDGTSEIYVSVHGSTTTGGEIRIQMVDGVGDHVTLNGSKSGAVISGTWWTNVSTVGGTFRMTHEDDIDQLRHASSATGHLQDLPMLR